ncbi:MAG TPA: permease [Candidatus Omnitrophota bacterium]|nr:permease [Candidatus Omnitrophota bacterium]
MLRLTADWIVYSLLRLPPEAKWAEAVHFFIYDSVKILSLLFIMIAGIGLLRTYLPQEKLKGWLTQKKGWGNFFAALFGAVTPFCSCSSIPIFLSFLKAGIPLGIGFSFLITSPLINEYLVVLMFGFFGWKITLAYIASGMMIGTACGFVIGKMRLEKYLVQDMFPTRPEEQERKDFRGLLPRIRFGIREALLITKKLWPWILLGVGAGALIHNYVPEQSIHTVMQKTGFWAVPAATVLGVPMYGSCAAIIPIAVVLFQKGVPLGTALAFMMAVAALSLPEAIMLRRAMRLHLIGIFFGVTTLAIIFTGYAFNILQGILAP